jgi:hypothetical protein
MECTMKRLHCFPVLALLVMVAAGCETQQTGSLDEPISAPPPQEKEGGPLEALAFWNWGGGDDQPDPVTKNEVLGDLTPELATTEKTPGEVDIEIARTLDYDGRQIWEDLLRISLLDEPSQLTYTPQP